MVCFWADNRPYVVEDPYFFSEYIRYHDAALSSLCDKLTYKFVSL